MDDSETKVRRRASVQEAVRYSSCAVSMQETSAFPTCAFSPSTPSGPYNDDVTLLRSPNDHTNPSMTFSASEPCASNRAKKISSRPTSSSSSCCNSISSSSLSSSSSMKSKVYLSTAAVTEFDVQEMFNERYKSVHYPSKTWKLVKRYIVGLLPTYRSLFPLFSFLSTYRPSVDISSDIVGGLSEGIMSIPQGMSYALMAGMPLVFGLYNGLVYPFVYSLFGSSRYGSVGVSAIEAVLCNEVVTSIIGKNAPMDFRVEVTVFLTLCAGGIYIIMRLLQLSVLADLLSNPMLSGFSTASAIIICTKQVSNILGLSASSEWLAEEWYLLCSTIHKTNPFSLLLGTLSVWILVTVKHINRKYRKQLRGILLPGPLFSIILFTLLTYAASLYEKPFSVKVVGHIPKGFPMAKVPFFISVPTVGIDGQPYKLNGDNDTNLYLRILEASVLLSITYFIIHVSIVKMIYKIESRKSNDLEGMGTFVGRNAIPSSEFFVNAKPPNTSTGSWLLSHGAAAASSHKEERNQPTDMRGVDAVNFIKSDQGSTTVAPPLLTVQAKKSSNSKSLPKCANFQMSCCRKRKSQQCPKSSNQPNANTHHRLNLDQELVALAVCQIVGSFFHCFPNATSLSRTSLLYSLHVASPLHGVVAALAVLLTLLFITSLLFYLPLSVLASVVIVGVYSITDFQTAYRLCLLGGLDFVIWIVSFATTLAFGAKWGVIASCGLSLLWLLKKVCRPATAVLGRLPGTNIYRNVIRFPMAQEYPGILIVRWDASLNFANVEYFERTMIKHVQDAQKRKIIINNNNAPQSNPQNWTPAPHLTVWENLQESGHVRTHCWSVVDGDFVFGPAAKGQAIVREMAVAPLPSPSLPPDYCKFFVELPVEEPNTNGIHTLIIDASSINSLDDTALSVIESLVDHLQLIGIVLLFANWKGPMRDFLDRAGFYKNQVALSKCFLSLHDAVLFALQQQQKRRDIVKK